MTHDLSAPAPAIRTLYWIAEYVDEVPVHEPSLEGAAYFLQHAKQDADDTTAAEYFGTRPLARPGDRIELVTLDILFDATATRVLLDDGAYRWAFDPPLPPDADFAAVRYGPDAGWSTETIIDPGDPSSLKIWDDLFDIPDPFAGPDPDDVIEHVAIGRGGRAGAVFDVVKGEPVLVLEGIDQPAAREGA